MVHVAIRSTPGTLLFRTWREARALWGRLTRELPFLALVLMPNHLHAALAGEAHRVALATGLRAYARWRNEQRDESGPVFEHGAESTPVRGRDHERRTLRYLYLNPCRAGLVIDPLGWAFSSYRDALGLALPAVGRRVGDPARLHAFVSGDPTVRVEGMALPERRSDGLVVALESLPAAASALTRTPGSGLRERGPARDLLVRAARALTDAPSAEIAALAGVGASTVRHHDGTIDAQIALVARVAGDPRFSRLDDGDLRSLPTWRAYRHLR